MNLKYKLGAAFFSIILLSMILLSAETTQVTKITRITETAQAKITPLRPFGGRILTVTPCDTGIWITVGPPVPGSFMIMPGTRVFKNAAFKPGSFVLGLSVPGTAAVNVCIVGIVPVGSGDFVNIVGTSL